ncbi:MAG: hypothetical protein ACE14M_02250 [Terriglobales bacterium]
MNHRSIILPLFVFTIGAIAQTTTQLPAPAPCGARAVRTTAVLQNPAEYNAYLQSVYRANAATNAASLEAFLESYPNSAMKAHVLELLMALYEQAHQPQNMMEAANRLLQVDPTNLRALSTKGVALESVAQCTKARLSLSIQPRREVVKFGSPVRVQAVIRNISNEELGLCIEPELQVLVNVVDADGKPLPLTHFGRCVTLHECGGGGIGSSGCGIRVGPPKPGFGFRPNTTRELEIRADNTHEFSRPGKYFIQMQLRDPDRNTVITSNKVAVTIADAAQWATYVQHLQRPFTLVISTPEETIKAGSQVRLDYVLTNGSQELLIDNALTKYDIQVRDSQGNLAPLTLSGRELRRKMGQGGGPRITLQPGDDVRGPFAYIEKIYDLTRPGTYTIQVARFDDDSKVLVKSNTISVMVTP